MYCKTNFRLWDREDRESHQPGLVLFQEIQTQETCRETSLHRSLPVVRSWFCVCLTRDNVVNESTDQDSKEHVTVKRGKCKSQTTMVDHM
jgi:hypothetical protein